jgi:hypothetical protein
LAFLPNPQNKPTVNHKDGDRRNPKLENLEWTTHRENTYHAFRPRSIDHSAKQLIDLARQAGLKGLEAILVALPPGLGTPNTQWGKTIGQSDESGADKLKVTPTDAAS